MEFGSAANVREKDERVVVRGGLRNETDGTSYEAAAVCAAR